MKHTLKIAAALALSFSALSGNPASAAEDPVQDVLAIDDPIHADAAQLTLEFERITGIDDSSAHGK
jgi:hypothetical protein